jgi:MIP family channel proteins
MLSLLVAALALTHNCGGSLGTKTEEASATGDCAVAQEQQDKHIKASVVVAQIKNLMEVFDDDEDSLSLLAVDQKVKKRVPKVEPFLKAAAAPRAAPAMENASALLEEAPLAISMAATNTRVPAFSFRAAVAEFIAMTLFVWVGCGTAMSMAKKEGSAWILQVSLAFGLMITVLAYTVGHYSGAHVNGAVTLSLWVSGRIGIGQMICNIIAQCAGAVLGAFILETMYGPDRDCTGGLGTNAVAEGWKKEGALLGEIMGTFLLVYVVHETCLNQMGQDTSSLAPLAIGLSVFLAHCVLIPIDGCSINPTRSFGPALVCSMSRKGTNPFRDMWIFVLGPCIGALTASLVFYWMRPAF